MAEATETDPDTLPSFDEAFAAARAEHSTPATDDGDGEEQAPAGEVSTRTGKEADGKPSPTKADTTPAGKSDSVADLISDKDFEALQKKFPDDPAAQRKELNRIWTQKTQALAEERRGVEGLAEFKEFLEAYDEDPDAAIAELAAERGFTLARTGEQPDTKPGTETKPQPTQADQIATVVADKIGKHFGEELDYVREPLSAAVSEILQELVPALAKGAVEGEIKPLKDQAEARITERAQELTAKTFDRLTERHPDWQKYEKAMFELSQQLAPNGMAEDKYLDMLYTHASQADRDAAEEERIEKEADRRVAKRLGKITKGAEEHHGRPASTPASEVVSGPPSGRLPSFEEAAAAARRGERWE